MSEQDIGLWLALMISEDWEQLDGEGKELKSSQYNITASAIHSEILKAQRVSRSGELTNIEIMSVVRDDRGVNKK